MKKIKQCSLVFVGILSFVTIKTCLATDEENQGFSGVSSYIPIQSRTTFYKFKALKNRTVGELYDTKEEGNQYLDRVGNNQFISTDCSINIGNIVTSNEYSDKENVVIIDGDVINAGRCDRR